MLIHLKPLISIDDCTLRCFLHFVYFSLGFWLGSFAGIEVDFVEIHATLLFVTSFLSKDAEVFISFD